MFCDLDRRGRLDAGTDDNNRAGWGAAERGRLLVLGGMAVNK